MPNQALKAQVEQTLYDLTLPDPRRTKHFSALVHPFVGKLMKVAVWKSQHILCMARVTPRYMTLGMGF